MSDESSARLSLPLLAAGQAQKEMTHNEALTLLDLLVQPAVADAGVAAPPGAPAEGECWIVGAAPIGDWAGQAGAIAGWTAGGWRFAAAAEGMSAWVIAQGCAARFVDGAWRLATPAAAVSAPAGGSVIDLEARTALNAILSALRDHGVVAT